LQYVEPYFSEKDIILGETSFKNISEELENCNFGLIFLTKNNIDSPWINFEAGALSKEYNSKVIPILWDTDLSLLEPSPLKQYQSPIKLEEERVRGIIEAINKSSDSSEKISNKQLDGSFNVWWPILKEQLDNVPKEYIENNEDTPKEPITQSQFKKYMEAIQRTVSNMQKRSIIDISNENRNYYQVTLTETLNIIDENIHLSNVIRSELTNLQNTNEDNYTKQVLNTILGFNGNAITNSELMKQRIGTMTNDLQ